MFKYLKIAAILSIPFLAYSQDETRNSIEFDGRLLQSEDTLSISDLKQKTNPIMILPELSQGSWKVRVLSAEGELLIEEDVNNNRIPISKYVARAKNFGHLNFSATDIHLVLHFED